MILVIGVGLIVGFVACLSDPFYGMLTLMGINIIQPGELYPVYNALHVERIMALLTIAMLFMRGRKFVFPKLTKWMLIFFGSVLASIPMSFWISNSITSAEDFAKTVILSVLLTSLAATRARLKTVLATFGILVAYLALTSLIQYFSGHFQFRMDVDRAVGLTSASDNPDTLGLTIATAIPFMYIFTLRGSRAVLRWLMRGLIVMVIVALLLTGSRGALLTFVVIAGAAVLCSRRRFIYAALSVIIGFSVWTVLPAQYKARYETVNNLQHDESYQNRILSWEGGWGMFLSNPLTGIGVGNYTYANGSKYWPGPRKVWLDAHSLYFKILGELGLLGVIAFTGFVVVFFKTNSAILRIMRARSDIPLWMRYYPFACNLALIGLLYCGYAYHDVYRTTWYFLAAVTAAFGLVLEHEAAAAPASGPTAVAEPGGESLELAPARASLSATRGAARASGAPVHWGGAAALGPAPVDWSNLP